MISSILRAILETKLMSILIKEGIDPTPTTDILLQEDGIFAILQEDGSQILLES